MIKRFARVGRLNPPGSIKRRNRTGIAGSAGNYAVPPTPGDGVWKSLGAVVPSNIRVPDWTEIIKGSTYRFDVPPGTIFRPIEWRQFTILDIYLARFSVTGAMAPPGGFFFRPGDFADDVDLDEPVTYTFIFEAQDTNGWSRIAHEDVTGVTSVQVNNITFWHYIPAGAPLRTESLHGLTVGEHNGRYGYVRNNAGALVPDMIQGGTRIRRMIAKADDSFIVKFDGGVKPFDDDIVIDLQLYGDKVLDWTGQRYEAIWPGVYDYLSSLEGETVTVRIGG